MPTPPYIAPWYLRNGMAMTAYIALQAFKTWETTIDLPAPPYQEHVFQGHDGVPIYGEISIPPNPKGTIIGTYGIVGDLDNQWFLKLLRRKAYADGYAVVLFDWRAHGKTGQLSPTLTSDGLNEGKDFIHIAAQAQSLGCPAPFFFTAYSLGGQLALWGIHYLASFDDWATGALRRFNPDDVGGASVICPNLDSTRSLRYLVSKPLGRYVEQRITGGLQTLSQDLQQRHPGEISDEALARADSIWNFDKELVIPRLGFDTVEDYYEASKPLPFLPKLSKPTLIIYAADDPLFSPAVIPDLRVACAPNPQIALMITDHGGHVGHLSSAEGQAIAQDPDPWWSWNRTLDWFNQKVGETQRPLTQAAR
ncbi:MAG: alpha/beta fold hydrolase [Cyanobacteria bacterium P01_H01_bin.130]